MESGRKTALKKAKARALRGPSKKRTHLQIKDLKVDQLQERLKQGYKPYNERIDNRPPVTHTTLAYHNQHDFIDKKFAGVFFRLESKITSLANIIHELRLAEHAVAVAACPYSIGSTVYEVDEDGTRRLCIIVGVEYCAAPPYYKAYMKELLSARDKVIALGVKRLLAPANVVVCNPTPIAEPMYSSMVHSGQLKMKPKIKVREHDAQYVEAFAKGEKFLRENPDVNPADIVNWVNDIVAPIRKSLFRNY